MVSGHVIHPLLQAFIAPPARVQENPQQQHCEHTGSSLEITFSNDQVSLETFASYALRRLWRAYRDIPYDFTINKTWLQLHGYEYTAHCTLLRC